MAPYQWHAWILASFSMVPFFFLKTQYAHFSFVSHLPCLCPPFDCLIFLKFSTPNDRLGESWHQAGRWRLKLSKRTKFTSFYVPLSTCSVMLCLVAVSEYGITIWMEYCARYVSSIYYNKEIIVVCVILTCLLGLFPLSTIVTNATVFLNKCYNFPLSTKVANATVKLVFSILLFCADTLTAKKLIKGP